jgi:hypothetical protein
VKPDRPAKHKGRIDGHNDPQHMRPKVANGPTAALNRRDSFTAMG